jgi:hypothetical protein
MNTRAFVILFICVAGPAIAFPLGIKVGSGWHEKFGPQEIQGRAAQSRAARGVLQLPVTLDGEPAAPPAAAGGNPSRELSPVYPTAATADRAVAVAQGLAPAMPSQEEANPNSTKPNSTEPTVQAAEPLGRADAGLGHYQRDAAMAIESRRHWRRYAYHGWRQRYASYADYPYFAPPYRYVARGRYRRPSNPFEALAGLFR